MSDFIERQVAAIARWLAVFVQPGQVVELRALHVGGVRAVCEVFGDLQALARRAAELDGQGAQACYFTFNPLRPDLAGARASARKADVLSRRWLMVDCDPVRPAGVMATEAERAAAWAVLDRCRGTLEAAGLGGFVVVDSGSGWHLQVPIDLPNDDTSQALIKAVLKGLAARCGDQQAKVELDTAAAVQLEKVPCTRVRKGESTAERPHRYAQVVEGPPWEPGTAAVNTEALRRLYDRWQREEARHTARREARRPELSADSYAAAALRQELAAIAGAPQGDRNNQLNRSAFALGQLVGAGALGRAEVEEALVAGGRQAGLAESEARTTVRSGLQAGVAQPRDLSGLNGSRPSTRNEHRSRAAAEGGEPLPARPPAGPAPFPLEVLPPTLQRLAIEGARSICCPPDFFGCGMLVAAASMIGASRALRVKDDWHVLPSLYLGIVAEPGSAKTPALARVLRPLKRQQKVNLLRYRQLKKDWKEQGDDRGEAPTYQRTFTTDVTTEKLAGLLAEGPRGILLHRDELTAWINGMDKYREGGKGDDRQVYISIWSQEPISIERKGHDEGLPVTVHRPFLCVLGGIQPDMLYLLAGRGGRQDGFLDRILFSYPRPVQQRKWSWETIAADTRRAWQEVLGRLYDLNMAEDLNAPEDRLRPRLMDLTPDARMAWEEWYAAHQAELHDRDFPPALAGHWAKLETYCARLALVLQLLWHASFAADFHPSDAPDVQDSSVRAAVQLLDYFKNHARRAHDCLEVKPKDRRVLLAVEAIRRHGGACTARDLLMWGVASVRTMTAARELIEELADRCKGRIETCTCEGNGKEVLTFRLHPAQASAGFSAG